MLQSGKAKSFPEGVKLGGFQSPAAGGPERETGDP